MIEAWLRRRIRRSTAARLVAAAALLCVYAYWMFARASPWTAPFGVLGNEMPELITGFPAGEPGAALDRLAEARSDYLWFQAFDLPLIALAAFVSTTAIAIGLKRVDLARSDGRYLLLAPAIYFAFELIENGLLALFAAGIIAPAGVLRLAQQGATVGKFAALLLTALFAIAGFFVWIGAAAFAFSRKST